MASKMTLEVDPAAFGDEVTTFMVTCEVDVGGSTTISSIKTEQKSLWIVEIASEVEALHEDLHFAAIYVNPFGIGKGLIDCLKERCLPVQEAEIELTRVEEEEAYIVTRNGDEVNVSFRDLLSQKRKMIVIPDIIAYRIARRILEETEDMGHCIPYGWIHMVWMPKHKEAIVTKITVTPVSADEDIGDG